MSRAVVAAGRILAGLLVVILVVAGPAWAQDSKSESGRTFFDVVNPDDLRIYCIYRGEAYSTGAFMCEGKQANVCAGPDETPPATAKPTGRAFWRSTAAEKICGATD